MYQRILVPIDGSDTAQRGLAEAVSWAASQKSRLVLLHVVADFPLMVEMASVMDYARVRAGLQEHGQRILDTGRQFAQDRGVEAETRLCELKGMRVSDAIVQEAEQSHCDLIVIGTHGRRGVNRLVLGSDAEAVLRQSPVPVLLVRQPHAHAHSPAHA